MSSVREWLSLHAIDADTVTDVLNAAERGLAHLPIPQVSASSRRASGIHGNLELLDFLNGAVMPALSELLAMPRLRELTEKVRWNVSEVPLGFRPYARPEADSVEVVLHWDGSPSSKLCLAHETAHAVQLLLTGQQIMPPVARETCAFLGELALIRWAAAHDAELAAEIVDAWHQENGVYLGDDKLLLQEALSDPASPYDYRMNYPLARVAAAYLWRADADIAGLFIAGSNAMALLPLSKIADVAGQTPNYLPPMAMPDVVWRATDSYRALGAMALLDIDVWKGESERRIEDYYATMLQNLQTQTAFVALDAFRRPIGYATWRHCTGDNTVTLTRQTAPFGDHLHLQRAVELHLGQNRDVLAQHSRSARQEQVAW